MADAMKEIGTVVEKSKPENVVLIVQQGLSSRQLVHHARNFNYIRSLVQDHASMYTSLLEPFSIETFGESYGLTNTLTLNSLEEINSLVNTEWNSLKGAASSPKYLAILIKESVGIENLDTAV